MVDGLTRDFIMCAGSIFPAAPWHGVRYEKRPILLFQTLFSISTQQMILN